MPVSLSTTSSPSYTLREISMSDYCYGVAMTGLSFRAACNVIQGPYQVHGAASDWSSTFSKLAFGATPGDLLGLKLSRNVVCCTYVVASIHSMARLEKTQHITMIISCI
jgi:hypothetical protein